MVAVKLKVGDKYKLSTDINYNDLIILYKQYIKTYGKPPTFDKCDSKHNMPQGRIITRILEENNILYGDFLLLFGKTKKVRTKSDPNLYDTYVQKFITICNDLGRTLRSHELCKYGLPSANWFIKYNKNNLSTYNDFLYFYNIDNNSTKVDKKYVDDKLIELEKKLNRPIKRDDIKTDNVGFSMIVINRIYGGLDNAKKELGLLPAICYQPRPFEYYKNHIDDVLKILSNTLNRKEITWQDIENVVIDGYSCEHKTILKSFNRNNIDFFAYLKDKGFTMNQNNWSNKFTFDDGERVLSNYEFDVSTYLREIGFEYNFTYYRDVLYSSFTNEKGKINCDYKLNITDDVLYIEVAGMLQGNIHNWKEINYKDKANNRYKETMIIKEKLLIDNNCNYLILFPSDFDNNEYKTIIQNKIAEVKSNAGKK